MEVKNTVCTACGCLCDDVQVHLEDNRITQIKNACTKGASFIYAGNNPSRRTPCLIGGHQVSSSEAIQEAARLLSQSKKSLIFGLDNSTLEAQTVAIKLAQKSGAVIDDVSSFCHGTLNEHIIKGTFPSCSLSEIKDANLLIYWGSNPHHSHPRHLSKFSYYMREHYSEAGWFPNAILSSVEVRATETTSICKPAFKLAPGGDKNFIRNILATMAGKDGTEDAQAFGELIKKSRFSIIFAGLGLVCALDDDFSPFGEMLQALSKWSRLAVIPMLGHFNMRGFNQSLHEETGYVNKVSFANGPAYGEEYSFLQQVSQRTPDCILIAGSDPLFSLPKSVIKNLEGIPIISLEPFVTTTSRDAQVVISVAISGLEIGGRVLGMDGQEITLLPVQTGEQLSDEEVLNQLLDRISQ